MHPMRSIPEYLSGLRLTKNFCKKTAPSKYKQEKCLLHTFLS